MGTRNNLDKFCLHSALPLPLPSFSLCFSLCCFWEVMLRVFWKKNVGICWGQRREKTGHDLNEPRYCCAKVTLEQKCQINGKVGHTVLGFTGRFEVMMK